MTKDPNQHLVGARFLPRLAIGNNAMTKLLCLLPPALSVIARGTRVAELASAAVSQWSYLNSSTSVNHDSLKVVVGIVGHFLIYYEDNTAYPNVRLVHTEVVAALSMLCSILWMMFWTTESYNIGADLFIFLAWFAAFGSLMKYVDCHHCTTSPFNIHYRNKIGGVVSVKNGESPKHLLSLRGVLFLGNAIITYAEFFSSKRRSTNSSPGVVEGGTVASDVQ